MALALGVTTAVVACTAAPLLVALGLGAATVTAISANAERLAVVLLAGGVALVASPFVIRRVRGRLRDEVDRCRRDPAAGRFTEQPLSPAGDEPRASGPEGRLP
jgi:hypothetical protein